MADDELADLMRAAQSGDSAAYVELLQRITPRVRQIVGHRRGFAGTADVEDLVQDILLSVHSARATYDPARPFMPWLLAIVARRLADGARRYARQRGREVALDDAPVTFGGAVANSDQGRFERVDALEKAMQSLPPGQRQAIELVKLKELSLKEAAAVSGSTIGALKVATHRAMAALRRTLPDGRTHED